MSQKDFWRNSRVAVFGAGSWGTTLAQLAAPNCREVRLWTHQEEQARSINANRVNRRYLPDFTLHERILATADLRGLFEAGEIQAVIWALPSSAARSVARQVAPLLRGDEIFIHASKGIEHQTLARISEVLRQELPCPRIGVVSGPNLALEVARGDPSAAVVASSFEEVVSCGQALLASERFRIYGSSDVVGVEWAGTLKNVLAIASGALDALDLGWNARAMLITRGLAEMVRFGLVFGGKESTFIGLAGLGDLLATSGSPLSRNYRVGRRLALGEKLETILQDLGGVAEGVRTTEAVRELARDRGISMPITESVAQLIAGSVGVKEALQGLMNRPLRSET